ncbi:MAG: NAD-dependent DNA ligase LigA [Clostridiales Family XIII bacterium]|jgi:DNA ligase (NAD+)|nr:NAD-dependent DNA ligase LigA [Clostridiales Family XIII bacterium]
MKNLIPLLDEAAKAYYNEDREILSNIEYDRLCDELAELENATGVVLAGSPSERVGYSVSSELGKEPHPAPLLSLDKTKNAEELRAWLGDKKGLLSWKLDGLTIALTYRDGRLSKAVTRGDGTVGEVVTHNAETFVNLPRKIAFSGALLLRGEAVIRYSDFERINAEIADDGAKYKNPRNLSSGSVRQLNSEITAKRHVRFYAFEAVDAEGVDFRNSADEQLKFLASIGFETVEYFPVTAETVTEEVRRFAERAGRSDLPSDGLVLTYDDLAYGASLGRTAKFPRNAIAFKWADELVTTTLKGVEWSASRTGLINPVAVFEPVEIEGSTVSRAGVHNVSIMEELALGVGDEIRVYKANMIIPQIAENLTRSGNISAPAQCPVCGRETEIRDGGGVRSLYCTNGHCPAKQIKSFTHFVGRNALNIEGVSESTLEKFIDKGFVTEFADIFRIDRYEAQIIETDGFGKRSYDNLIAAINAARHTTGARLLYGLGIPGIGSANAKLICKAFDFDWDRIENAAIQDLVAIDGIGTAMAENFVNWFANADNKEKVSRILGQIDFDEETASADGGLDGLTFVVTGSLSTYGNRDALKAYIESKGGKVTGAVSEKTDYLINNDAASPSAKNKKAKQLGVRIITEDEFREMADRPVSAAEPGERENGRTEPAAPRF